MLFSKSSSMQTSKSYKLSNLLLASSLPALGITGLVGGLLRLVATQNKQLKVDINERKANEANLQGRARQQEAIAHLSQRALLGTDIQTLLDEAVVMVSDTLRVDYCMIFELPDDEQWLELRSSCGSGLEEVWRIPNRVEESQASFTLTEQEPVMIEDLCSETRFQIIPALQRRNLKSSLSLPVYRTGTAWERPFGVLEVYSQAPRSFNQEDINFLQAMANMMMTALQWHQAEDARADLVNLVENAFDFICLSQANGKLVYLNRAGREMVGIDSTESLTGRDFFTDQFKGRQLSEITRHLQEQGHWAGEIELRHFETAQTIPALLNIFRIRQGASQGEDQLGSIIRDITEIKQAQESLHRYNEMLEQRVNERAAKLIEANEQLQREIIERYKAENALRESEQRFRQLAESVQEIFWIIPASLDRISYISPAYKRITGYEPDLVYQDPMVFVQLAHPDDQPALLRHLLQAPPPGQTVREIEYRITRQDGQIRWLWTRSFPVYDERGQLNSITGISGDITELKQVQEGLQLALEKEKELGELKSRFISMASHEFRTPLSTILTSTELLEHYPQAWSDEKRSKHLKRIEIAVKGMTQLLDDVLIIGKTEAGKLDYQPGWIDLAQLCREMVEDWILGLDNRHQLIFEIEDDLEQAWVDEKLVRQIINNLLSNAIKYSPGGGQVYFKVHYAGAEKVLFQIEDQGIGILPEDLPYIFDVFHRASNAGTIAGTGLGMTIVKNCVDIHQGQIEINSWPGQGTCVQVTLPITGPIAAN